MPRPARPPRVSYLLILMTLGVAWTHSARTPSTPRSH